MEDLLKLTLADRLTLIEKILNESCPTIKCELFANVSKLNNNEPNSNL